MCSLGPAGYVETLVRGNQTVVWWMVEVRDLVLMERGKMMVDHTIGNWCSLPLHLFGALDLVVTDCFFNDTYCF